MHDTKTIIFAQLFISGMMAFLMTGFFGFIHATSILAWVAEWAKAFVVAWPVAFILSLAVGRLGFKLAVMCRRHI
ncbi:MULTISPECIES: DUF2798 domain-containing protein [unclassified Rhizobium]|uniref:DUF2798 domain-containing protein n=1 Tax=unclassified Rhizobium TaxID=2613769 RepID=UPI0004237420|nr:MULTISPECIES: DUF2798 domain-containing protein [unclassified Rhizobium]MBD9455745.1 DUF2798 domain-containing protein [Rhizobium sp. RHZ02]